MSQRERRGLGGAVYDWTLEGELDPNNSVRWRTRLDILKIGRGALPMH